MSYTNTVSIKGLTQISRESVFPKSAFVLSTYHKKIIKPKQTPLNTHTKLPILLIFITRQTQEPEKVAFKVFITFSLTVFSLSTVPFT